MELKVEFFGLLVAEMNGWAFRKLLGVEVLLDTGGIDGEFDSPNVFDLSRVRDSFSEIAFVVVADLEEHPLKRFGCYFN